MPQQIPSYPREAYQQIPSWLSEATPRVQPPVPAYIIEGSELIAWDANENRVWRFWTRRDLQHVRLVPPQVIYQLETHGAGAAQVPLEIEGFDTVPPVPSEPGIFWLQETVDGRRRWSRNFTYCFSSHPRDQAHFRDWQNYVELSRREFERMQQQELQRIVDHDSYYGPRATARRRHEDLDRHFYAYSDSVPISEDDPSEPTTGELLRPFGDRSILSDRPNAARITQHLFGTQSNYQNSFEMFGALSDNQNGVNGSSSHASTNGFPNGQNGRQPARRTSRRVSNIPSIPSGVNGNRLRAFTNVPRNDTYNRRQPERRQSARRNTGISNTSDEFISSRRRAFTNGPPNRQSGRSRSPQVFERPNAFIPSNADRVDRRSSRAPTNGLSNGLPNDLNDFDGRIHPLRVFGRQNALIPSSPDGVNGSSSRAFTNGPPNGGNGFIGGSHPLRLLGLRNPLIPSGATDLAIDSLSPELNDLDLLDHPELTQQYYEQPYVSDEWDDGQRP